MLNRMPNHPSDSSPSRDWPKYKVNFWNVPRICIGFNLKGSSDYEGAKSPTSPLDIKTFSGVGITHSRLSSPRQQRVTIPIGSPHGFAKPTSQTGMEHSESYTCVTSHGPKSITKHIYTHSGMESETVECPVRKHEQQIWNVASPPRSYVNVPVFPLADFLSACYLCKRQLSHGKDIYMYRGDKAFCSVECRCEQILMDEQMETFSPPSPFIASYGGKIFSTSTATAA